MRSDVAVSPLMLVAALAACGTTRVSPLRIEADHTCKVQIYRVATQRLDPPGLKVRGQGAYVDLSDFVGEVAVSWVEAVTETHVVRQCPGFPPRERGGCRGYPVTISWVRLEVVPSDRPILTRMASEENVNQEFAYVFRGEVLQTVVVREPLDDADSMQELNVGAYGDTPDDAKKSALDIEEACWGNVERAEPQP